MTVKRIQNDELYHHGVKGQKWGVRRYQNPDGSLTPEGIQRYGNVKKFNKVRNKQIYSFKKDLNNRNGLSVNLYNRASDKFNKQIHELNKRHENDDDYGENFSSKSGQKYVKEVNKLWQDCYDKSLKEMANKYELVGEDYLKENNIMAKDFWSYGMYEGYIKK